MKFMKKRGYNGTVRKIVSDDSSKVLGVVGTLQDLMELGIVEPGPGWGGSPDTWCCLLPPTLGESLDRPLGWVGATRDEAVRRALDEADRRNFFGWKI